MDLHPIFLLGVATSSISSSLSSAWCFSSSASLFGVSTSYFALPDLALPVPFFFGVLGKYEVSFLSSFSLLSSASFFDLLDFLDFSALSSGLEMM